MKAPNLTHLLFALFLLFFQHSLSQTKQKSDPAYKQMMTDFSINFYTVCDSAEAYFSRNDKGKGSGYKPFLRWKFDNESKYAPSGDRMVDHYMPYNEYLRIKRETSSTITNRLFENEGWNYLGPSTITRITGHYSAGLGRLEFVEVNKNNAEQIYVGSRSGGLWRTSNEGDTWSHNTDFLPASGVNAISANPFNFDDVFINVRAAENGTSFGIYRSLDGGATFLPTAFIPANIGHGGLGSNFKINVIEHHPTIPNLIFVGTSRGVYRSTDNLQTWTRQVAGGNIMDIEFHPTNENIIYIYDRLLASNYNKVLRSTDLGLTYTGETDLTGNNQKQLKISVSPTCPDCVYASSDNGIWKSEDAGLTYVAIQSSAPEGIELWQATPNDLDTTKFVSGYVDLYRSEDSGETFNKCTWWSLGSGEHGPGSFAERFNNSSSYIHADTNYLECVNGVFYSCSDGYLSKSSDNGATWQKISLTMGIRENYCVGTSQSNHYVSICGSQDNGTSIKNEDEWIEVFGADGMEGIVHPLNPLIMIGSTQFGSRGRYNDGAGVGRVTITPPNQNGSWIAPLFFDPTDHMTIFSLGDKVHKSSNLGTTWVELGAPASFEGGTITTGAIANNPNKIVATRGSQIELSTDGGVTFSNINNNLPNSTIRDVQFDPKNDETIIVTYDSYQNNNQKVFISFNSGQNWQNITYNLGNMPIYCAIIDHTEDKTIYLGASIGIYKKRMNENVWTLFNENLPNVSVRDLAINYGSNTIKAATWGRGLWEYSLAERQNYPAIIKTAITNPPTFEVPKQDIDQYITAEIEYENVLTNVHAKWATDSPVFNDDQIIAMHYIGDNNWKSSVPIPSFPAGTKLYFKVYATGSNNDTSETYPFMYEIKPNEYCEASGENTSGNLRINSFSCANLTNKTNAYNAYSYYDATPIILEKGNTYTATGNFNTSWTNNDFIIWIDYNNDLIFSEDEKVVLDIDTGIQGSGEFTVPLDIESGFVRMRVRLGYWGNYGSACGTTLGEVEDYLVEITGESQTPIISYTGDTTFCLNSPFTLNYSGDPVDEVHWTLQKDGEVYSFTGNSMSTSTLPLGIYDLVIAVKKSDFDYCKLFTTAIELKTTTWNGTTWSNGEPDGNTSVEFTGNYYSQSDIFACEVKISNNIHVTFNEGHNLWVNGKVEVENSSLLTMSNNTNLLQTKDDVNAGTIKVFRNSNELKRLDYTLWSSPVNGNQTVKDFSPNTLNNRFYFYNTQNNTYNVIANPLTQLFLPGSGYLIRTPDNHPTTPTIWEGEFTGTPNNGSFQIDLSYFNPDQSYNLIGNPYPSAIDAELFLDANVNEIEGTLYFWRKTNNASGTAYATYTKAGATTTSPTSPVPNGIIQVGQGFIVEAKNPVNPFVLFSNQQRIANNDNQFFRNDTAEKHRFWMNLTNNDGLFSQMMVGYIAQATNDFDFGIDGKNINDSEISISSLIEDIGYTIQGKQLPFEETDIVPLQFKTNQSGEFTFELANIEGLFAEGQNIYIKDNLYNSTHNLSESNYTFSSGTGEFNNRFEIVYQNSTLDLPTDIAKTLIVYPNPATNQSLLHFFGIQEEFTCTIFDAIGKEILSKLIKNNELYLQNMQTGIYLVKINTDSKVHYLKLIVK